MRAEKFRREAARLLEARRTAQLRVQRRQQQAATTIQVIHRAFVARRRVVALRISMANRLAAAVTIQRFIRYVRASEMRRILSEARERRMKAAVNIQRVIRGCATFSLSL